jgi:hypothetical protein
MDEVFAEFPDVDGNFVREFQTRGFSPRVFELALYAYFREQGYDLDRAAASPDFIIRGDVPFAVEATTTNPADMAGPGQDGLPIGEWPLIPDDLPAAEREFVFQVGKALRRKLLKRDAVGRAYWELPQVGGISFVIAVEAFHHESALFHSLGFVAEYLYGRRDVASYNSEGHLQLRPVPITEHSHGGRRIPSGLFALPEARHLSAVLFSNSSTVSVFNRIGTERGYGLDDVAMLRAGTMPDPDPDASLPQLFGYVVEECPPEERETFGEALNVLHNPWTELPLPPRALRGVTEHELLNDGRMLTTSSSLAPFASQTVIYQGKGARTYARAHLARWLASSSEMGDQDADRS